MVKPRNSDDIFAMNLTPQKCAAWESKENTGGRNAWKLDFDVMSWKELVLWGLWYGRCYCLCFTTILDGSFNIMFVYMWNRAIGLF
jgi:hypothetical protein